jgi:hypothetical protein
MSRSLIAAAGNGPSLVPSPFRRLGRPGFLTALALLLVLLPAPAAEPPALPKGLLAQWSRFQAALKADDVKLLAEVTHFPLESNEFGGTIRSAEVLAKRYKTIFPEKTKQCLLSSTLKAQEWDGKVHYEVYCDVGDYPIRFIFGQVGQGFYLTGIDNINE